MQFHMRRGRRASILIGNYPAISLAKAREMATVNQANIYTEGYARRHDHLFIRFQFVSGMFNCGVGFFN